MTRYFYIIISVVAFAGLVNAQSSSLYTDQTVEDRTDGYGRRQGDELNPAIAQYSFAAVGMPELRRFQVHDLVTIVINESVSNKSSSSIGTSKDAKVEGEIAAYPDIRLNELLQMQLRGTSNNSNPPTLDISTGNEFNGEGDYSRQDTFIARLTARIIDIKPNGLLVLEARKHIQTEKETLDIAVTGTCRREDVRADNTIVSSQIFDLRVDKQHLGEIHKATKKGLITKFFETFFNF